MCYVHVISHVHVYVLCNEDITKFIWIHFALMWDTCNTVYGCIMIVDVKMQPLLHFTIASSREKLFFITLRTKQYNPDVKHNAINIYKCFKANFRHYLVSIPKILDIWSRYYHIKSFILAILKLFSSIWSKKHPIFSVFMTLCHLIIYKCTQIKSFCVRFVWIFKISVAIPISCIRLFTVLYVFWT